MVELWPTSENRVYLLFLILPHHIEIKQHMNVCFLSRPFHGGKIILALVRGELEQFSR